MCGIVGVISKEKQWKFQLDEIEKMSMAQKHRGPDDHGMVGIVSDSNKAWELENEEIFYGKSIVAFNRLSIQDLSHSGHQPMMDENRDVVIAFNGEIYNFKELRNELEKKGYRFKSKTDTEVILNLYLEYGIEDTLDKLNGMFAMAIYDLRIQKVYIVRDRFGVKPMYFANLNGYYLFSSEVKSFLQFSEFNPALDEDVLQEYTLFRNVTDGVLLRGVVQILPGEVYQISLVDNSVNKYRFFSISHYNRCEEMIYKPEYYKEVLWETLKRAVGRQIISDVKVGCQLSGGIDSSLITFIASKEHNLNDTISVVVDDERFTEEKYIDYVNNKLNLNSHKLILNADYYVEQYVKSIWYFEGIVAHTQMAGIYQIAEEAKKNVTVLLSGEGADEVFGGYNTFLKTIHCPKDRAEELIINGNGTVDSSIAVAALPGIDINKQFQKRKDICASLQGSIFDRQIKYEMMTYLPELLLRQDKMSMANSIENRVPMLDNEVVECAFNIPENLLINKNEMIGKDILKQLCIPIFGEKFAYRKKMGFGVPANNFLMSNPQFSVKILESAKKRDVINWSYIHKLGERVETLRGSEAEVFFKMFGFEVWCQLFLDGRSMEDIMYNTY